MITNAQSGTTLDEIADGIYRIHVLDYDFFVTVDNTPPDARLMLGSAFRTVAEKTACVPAGGSVHCSKFAGPVVDLPLHALTGRAADAALASWVLEAGTGSNPAQLRPFGPLRMGDIPAATQPMLPSTSA